MKKFGDLIKGDYVFLLKLGPEKWIIHTYKVLMAEPEIIGNDIKLTLDNVSWSGYYPKDKVSARDTHIWSDREEALKYALRKTKNERDYLLGKIDELISRYDKIEKFIEKYDRC